MRATIASLLVACGLLQACSPQSGQSPADHSAAPAAQQSPAASQAKPSSLQSQASSLSSSAAQPQAQAASQSQASSALQSQGSGLAAQTSRDTGVGEQGRLQATSSGLSSQVTKVQGLVAAMGGEVRGQDIHVAMPADTLFDFDKAEIRAEAATELDKLAALIQATQGTVRLLGHTDAKGSTDYNQRLSERRASAVSNWLVAHGVPATRLQVEGRGASEPVQPNQKPNGSDDPQARAQNRRVEAVITQT